jgi:hypothetical protein
MAISKVHPFPLFDCSRRVLEVIGKRLFEKTWEKEAIGKSVFESAKSIP